MAAALYLYTTTVPMDQAIDLEADLFIETARVNCEKELVKLSTERAFPEIAEGPHRWKERLFWPQGQS